ncbi:MAG: hypothetical protein ACREX4_24115 [Gammaproteobacteria bacterium]
MNTFYPARQAQLNDNASQQEACAQIPPSVTAKFPYSWKERNWQTWLRHKQRQTLNTSVNGRR